MHGKLPSELGVHLPNLRDLLLGTNRFTGYLPASLVNATKINRLDMSCNGFTGRLPPEIGMLCPKYLSVAENQIVASTTQDWEFMTLLTNCTRLRVLKISGNMLGGVLPSSVGNLSAQLQVLYVAYNMISGTIPSGISNLVRLNYLTLSHNRFTGVLPESMGRLNLLQGLYMHNNLLTGLLTLSAWRNKFEGPLPGSLGSLQEISAVDLAYNKFTGQLLKEIFNQIVPIGHPRFARKLLCWSSST